MSDELDFEDEGARRSGLLGWPLLIALLSCLALILAAAFAPALLPRLDFWTMALAGAGIGVALWLLVLLAGSRTGQWLVVVGALVALPLTGALAGMGAGRIHAARASIDARTFAEVDLAADGRPSVPGAAAERGVASAALLTAIREAEKDDKAYGDAVVKRNLGVLSSPYLLQQQSGILSDCASISSLEPVAQDHGKRARARTAQLVAEVERSELPVDAKPGALRIASADKADAVMATRIEVIRASRARCEVLARRTWQNVSGYFGFTSTDDRVDFNATSQRLLEAVSQIERLQRAAKEERIAGREQVREVLMR